MRIDLSNPLIMFTSVWCFVLFLTKLKWTTQILEMNNETLFLVFSNLLSMAVIYFCVSVVSPKCFSPSKNSLNEAACLDAFSKKTFLVWLVGVGINVVYSGGFPMLWLYAGSDKSYPDFGIPSVYGFVNAVYFFTLSARFIVFCIRKKKTDLLKVLSLLCWQILAISRASMVLALVQMLGIYFVFNQTVVKKLFKLGLMLLLVIYFFGVIGDFRNGDSSERTVTFIDSLVDDNAKPLFDKLPSGFVWFYIYLTSSLNNVIGVVVDLQPNYIPHRSVASLLPTVLRDQIYDPLEPAVDLVTEALNASTFYSGYLSDFGILGAIIGMMLWQFIAVHFYFKARSKQLWVVAAYSALFSPLVLSIFWDYFTSLVIIAQIGIAFIFKRYYEKSLTKPKEIQVYLS